MRPSGPVHFIHLGGEWWPQYERAITTARVHGDDIRVWAADPHLIPMFHGATVNELRVPRWLDEHPIKLANVKDYYAYRLLREHGGIYLDLDTISLRPAWDLLTADVCMSTEFPPGQEAGKPFNTAVLLARRGALVLLTLEMESRMMLADGEKTWGAVGPHLISAVAEKQPEHFSPAPYRALNGWSYHSIGDYYANPRDPGEDVRVIHLYSSDHMDEFLADEWTP